VVFRIIFFLNDQHTYKYKRLELNFVINKMMDTETKIHYEKVHIMMSIAIEKERVNNTVNQSGL